MGELPTNHEGHQHRHPAVAAPGSLFKGRGGDRHAGGHVTSRAPRDAGVGCGGGCCNLVHLLRPTTERQSMNTDTLPLTDAVNSLRGELEYALEQAPQGQYDLRFAVEAIEVELQVVRTAGGEVSASGGLWQVLTVGGKATYSSAATHKIKLVLKPRKDGSLETLIGEESDRPA
jgi:hypothetical protein